MSEKYEELARSARCLAGSTATPNWNATKAVFQATCTPYNIVEITEDFNHVTAERDALQQRLTAADERADVLEAVSVKQAALLDELGIPLDEVDDLFGETLKNAKRYEYLRSVMAVENFPTPHPEWSEPSEAESKRIDDLCDAALNPAEGGGDEQ